MTSIRRIGLLTPAWPGQNTANGIATSVYFLAQGLREIGVTPIILALQIDGPCPDDIPVIQVQDLGWRFQDRLRARFGDASLEGNRHVARNIAGAIREASLTHGLDAVLIEESNGWAAMVQDFVSVPIFVVLHGPWVLHKKLQSRRGDKEDKRREERENRGFLAATGLIAPSQNVLVAVESAAELANKPSIVLPNTVVVNVAQPLAGNQKRDDILFVGRFDRHKGGDTVLAAFTHLIETHPQARLTFAGVDAGVRQPDGSFTYLEALLPDLPEKVRSNLIYKGRVDRTEVARLRAEHPIALIASRYENLNYTLLEAMSAGQAIVSTNVGGPAEILEDGQTALLVPSEQPVQMASALARLLDHPDLRVQLGASARARIEADFKPAVIAQQTVSFIEKTLAG